MCLNAFGIHRGGPHWSRELLARHGDVLNAFGITEVALRGRRHLDVEVCFNAFGITRWAQQRCIETRYGSLSSVTPFVITGWAHRHRVLRRKHSLAPRPFGITEGASGERRRERAGGVCSTPFGITEVGHSTEPIVWALGRGAQRLRHHRGWATSRGEEGDVIVSLCSNYFRHHRGGATTS